jgi:hypothetical protein
VGNFDTVENLVERVLPHSERAIGAPITEKQRRANAMTILSKQAVASLSN